MHLTLSVGDMCRNDENTWLLGVSIPATSAGLMNRSDAGSRGTGGTQPIPPPNSDLMTEPVMVRQARAEYPSAVVGARTTRTREAPSLAVAEHDYVTSSGGKNPLKLVIVGMRSARTPWFMGRYERTMRATVHEWQEQANLLRLQSLSDRRQRSALLRSQRRA